MRRMVLPLVMVWSLACTGLMGEGDEPLEIPAEEPTDAAPVEGEEPEEAEEGEGEEEGGEDLFDTGEDKGDKGDDDKGEKGGGAGGGEKGDGEKGDGAKKGKKPDGGGGGGKAKSFCLVATGAMTATVRIDMQGGAVTGGEVTYADTKSGSAGAATGLTGKKTGASVKASGKGTVDGKDATIEVEVQKTDDAVVLKIDGKTIPKVKKKPCS